MNKDGYNGWTNYETWSIALLIDNTELYYNYAREICISNKENYDKELEMQELIEETIIDYNNLTMEQRQMMKCSLDEIDYRELIKHYQEE